MNNINNVNNNNMLWQDHHHDLQLRQLHQQQRSPSSSSSSISPTTSIPPSPPPTTTASAEERINGVGQLIMFIMSLVILAVLVFISAFCNPRNRRLPRMTIPDYDNNTEMDHRDYRRRHHLHRLHQTHEERKQYISKLLVVKHVLSGEQYLLKANTTTTTTNMTIKEQHKDKNSTTSSSTDDDYDHDSVVMNTSGSSTICSGNAISTSNNNNQQNRHHIVADNDARNRLDEGETRNVSRRSSSSLERSIDSSTTDSSSVEIPMGGDKIIATAVSTYRTNDTPSSSSPSSSSSPLPSPSLPRQQRAFLRHLKSNIIVVTSFDELDHVDNCDCIDEGHKDIESPETANVKQRQQQPKEEEHVSLDPPSTTSISLLSANPLVSSTTTTTSTILSSSLMTCAICLNTYNIGDEICWSVNPECQHAFHHDCIEKWLLRSNNEKNECPICRNDYLKKYSSCFDDDNDDDYSNNNNNQDTSTTTTACPVNTSTTSRILPSFSANE